jgi:ribosome-associated protein
MADAIEVGGGVRIPRDALSIRAVRASGPGGQNVNKVSSKVELRAELSRIEGLDDGARARLADLCRGSLDAEGRLLVVSQKTRDQRQNLVDAEAKVVELVRRALVRPKKRRPTKPTRGSVERRIAGKKQRANVKAARRERDD